MEQPKRYRKKPVVIEAIQYVAPNRDYSGGKGTKGNVDALKAFGVEVEPTGVWDPPSHADLRIYNSSHDDWNLMHPGDWLLKGTAGEFYPCDPDIFAMAYEPATGFSFSSHPECPELAICVCRDNGKRQLLDQLYEAVHGERPPAMPLSPAELWERLLDEVRRRS